MVVIYKITNPKGKIYIGQTKNFKQRLSNYRSPNKNCIGRKLFNSIKKYNWENHKIEVIHTLELLLNNLQSLSDTLSNLKVPGAPLAPAVGGALFSELLVPSTTLSNVCKDMLSDIRDKNYLSKITKTK